MTQIQCSAIFVLALKIDIRNITQRKKGFALTYKPEELKHMENVRFASDVTLSIDVHQTGVNSFVLKCQLEGKQILECSRTLKDFESPLNLDFEILAELNSKSEKTIDVDNMDEEAYEIQIQSHQTEFDISEIVRQEVLLQEPMVPIDPQADTQEWIEAEEEEEKTDPRWDALKKLKGNQESQ